MALLLVLIYLTSEVNCGYNSQNLYNETITPFSQELHTPVIIFVEGDTLNGTGKNVSKRIITEDDTETYFEEIAAETEVQLRVQEDRKNYCNSIKTCLECMQSSFFPCFWCHKRGCVDNAENFCPHVVRIKQKHRNSLALCPYIERKGPLLLPAGPRAHIVVKFNALDPELFHMDIKCQIIINNQITYLRGIIFKDRIYCRPVKFILGYSQTQFGTFRVTWGGVNAYSNKVQVILYKCNGLAEDCESCRMLPKQYGCAWCEDLSNCMQESTTCDQMLYWTFAKMSCMFKKKTMIFV